MGIFSGALKFLGGAVGSALVAPAEPPSVTAASPGTRALVQGRATAGALQAQVTALQADVAVVPTAGGFVTLDDGSRVLMSASGVIARPQFFLAAGAQIPGGSRIVSVSPDGLLFGLRRARRRRTFRTELARCTSVVKTADKLLKVLGRRK